MSLGTPWMLLLLPLLAVAGWLMARARRLQVEAACRLKGVAPEGRRAFFARRDWLVLAALTCVVVALARPRWNPRPYEVERRGRDLVIALDVSRSMLAADLFPSRLEMARIAIHEALPALAGQRMALVTFAGSASVPVPLTLDHGFVRYMLDRADPTDMDTGSTSLQAAIEKVTDTVLTDAAGRRRDLVVFTDGEDHLSNIDQTAELLAECDARVLIIGLGDPVRGAPVPDPLEDNQWMRHNDAQVISRLQEHTLEQLADQAPNVTYYPARTRPFDFVPLYRRWIAGAGDDVVAGGRQQVRYTEGYPYLLGLAIVLWLASTSIRAPAMRSLVLLAALLPGCAQRIEDDAEVAFRARFKQGSELQRFAREQTDTDPFAERSLLVDAREEFLRAALLRHGDFETAQQITSITRRLRELETVIEQHRAEEKKRREKLADTIQRLEKLTDRQERLSERSQRMLRRLPVPEGEHANLPEEYGPSPETEQALPQKQLSRLAAPMASEQTAVREATGGVLDSLTLQRDTLREILTKAYGDIGKAPATEIDPIVDLLAETRGAQQQALAHLSAGAVRLPKANTALRTAAGRMRQALDELRGLQPPTADVDDGSMASRQAGDFDGNVEGRDSDVQHNANAQPIAPGDFQEALSLRSLPVPDYTPAEIMAEEAANQKKRARRKAAGAAAKVEKNW